MINKKQRKFGPEVLDAIRKDKECPVAEDILSRAGQLSFIADDFAHNVGDGDQLRLESNDVNSILDRMIDVQLATKSPRAVANALFWAASRVAEVAIDEEEDEEPTEEPTDEEVMEYLERMCTDEKLRARFNAVMGIEINRVDDDHVEVLRSEPSEGPLSNN
jgi:hypothetical protein